MILNVASVSSTVSNRAGFDSSDAVCISWQNPGKIFVCFAMWREGHHLVAMAEVRCV